MRITKLHLLLVMLIIGALVYLFYFGKVRTEHLVDKGKEVMQFKDELVDSVREGLEKSGDEEDDVISGMVPNETEDYEIPDIGDVQAVPNIEEVTYRVERGDTLWSIAKKPEHFGKGHRWYDIWKANEDKIFDFDSIRAGQEIVIPLDKPDGYAWPITPEDRRRKILGLPPAHNGF